MDITINDIIAITLSSSLLAAVLTVAGNFWLQRSSFKQEYYKKLLDKRLNAYKKVEAIITILRAYVHLENGKICPTFCTQGQAVFGNFFETLGNAIDDSVWISQETSMEIMKLNVFLLNEINNQIDENKNFDAQLLALGSEYAYVLKDYRSSLENQLYKDFKSLHKMKRFVNKTVKSSAGLQLKKKESRLQK